MFLLVSPAQDIWKLLILSMGVVFLLLLVTVIVVLVAKGSIRPWTVLVTLLVMGGLGLPALAVLAYLVTYSDTPMEPREGASRNSGRSMSEGERAIGPRESPGRGASSDGHSSDRRAATRDTPAPPRIEPPLVAKDPADTNDPAGTTAPAESTPPPTPSTPPSSAVGTAEGLPVDVPGDAPAWIDEPPRYEGDTYWEVVKTDQFLPLEEMQQELDDQLQAAVDRYVRRSLGSRYTVGFPVEADLIQRSIVRDRYQQVDRRTVVSSYAPVELYRGWARLRFDAAVREKLEAMHHRVLAGHRLKYTSIAAGLLLALVATVFGYLKLDTLTRGYYSGWLKLTTAAIVIGIAFASVNLMDAFSRFF